VNSEQFIYRIVLSNFSDRDCVLAANFENALEEAHKAGFKDSQILDIQLVPDEEKESLFSKQLA
jgi:hypothetical protein